MSPLGWRTAGRSASSALPFHAAIARARNLARTSRSSRWRGTYGAPPAGTSRRRQASRAPHTLATALADRRNHITPLRLLLALLVVASHSYLLGGFGPDPIYALSGGRRG